MDSFAISHPLLLSSLRALFPSEAARVSGLHCLPTEIFWNKDLPSGTSFTEHKLSIMAPISHAFGAFPAYEYETIGDRSAAGEKVKLADFFKPARIIWCSDFLFATYVITLPSYVHHFPARPSPCPAAVVEGLVQQHFYVVSDSRMPTRDFDLIQVYPFDTTAIVIPGIVREKTELKNMFLSAHHKTSSAPTMPVFGTVEEDLYGDALLPKELIPPDGLAQRVYQYLLGRAQSEAA